MKAMERLEAEAKFLNAINRLADCYGCQVKVDMKSHLATFEGDQCDLLAKKLCEIFKSNEVDEAEAIASVPVCFIVEE